MDNYWPLTITLTTMLLTGTLLCLPFYHWNIRRFLHSQLFIKCIMWAPIYVIFLAVIFSPHPIGSIVFISIMAVAFYEFLQQSHRKITASSSSYMILFVIATAITAICIGTQAIPASLILATGVSSVLSDVLAFFCGTSLGRHPLPKWINSHKSWEGVGGQLIGGVVGALVVSATYNPAYGVMFGLTVGAASAIGDIANSIAKRSLAIKDWGSSIPGHGGFLDRFSSLMTAYLVIIILYAHGILPTF